MSDTTHRPDPLDRLVCELAEFADPACCGPSAYLATTTPDGLEPRSAHHLDGLTGLTAPPSIDAAVVVATGRAHAIDPTDPGHPRADLAELGRVGVAFGIDRAGTTCAYLRLPVGAWVPEETDEGRIPDTLRRVLGLPTAPAPAGPGRLLATWWTGAILRRVGEDWARASTRRLSWASVVAAHPLGSQVPGGRSPLWASEKAVEAVATIALGWERLRSMTASGVDTGGVCPADLAGWMDAGMFARHVLDQLPSSEALCDTVAADLTPAALRRFATAIGAAPDAGASRARATRPR